MAAILPFAIEVGYEGFSGLQVLCTYVHVHAYAQVQVRMHLCVHLHTRACMSVVFTTGVAYTCTGTGTRTGSPLSPLCGLWSEAGSPNHD